MTTKPRATTRRVDTLTPVEVVGKVADDTGVPPDVLAGVVLWGVGGFDPEAEATTVAGVTTVAQQLQGVHDQWDGKTSADPWDIAVASFDDLEAAATWAQDGTPPYDPDRTIPLSEFVIRARSVWKG
jgi:hypothetical protein